VQIRKTRGAVFDLNFHIVFVTKYRLNVFDQGALTQLENHFEEICRGMGCDLVEFGGEQDHVHLVVNCPPSLAISSLVNSLKGASSRMLRKNRKDIEKKLSRVQCLWSPSYFVATTGGVPLEVVKQYVANQGGGLTSPA
jgi:putative transposase